MNTVATAVVEAMLPVIRNIGAVAEYATCGRVVNVLAWMLVIRALIPVNQGPVRLYNEYQAMRLKNLLREEEAKADKFE